MDPTEPVAELGDTTELAKRLSKVFPKGNWSLDEDLDGQLIIYTGLREVEDGQLIDFESQEEPDVHLGDT
jgi:hypothetical protein